MQAAPAEEEKSVQEFVEEKRAAGVWDGKIDDNSDEMDLVNDDDNDVDDDDDEDLWDLDDGDNEEEEDDDDDDMEDAKTEARKKRSIYRKPHKSKKLSYGYKRYWPVHKIKYPIWYNYGYKYPYGKVRYNIHHKKPYYGRRRDPYGKYHGKHHGYRKW